MFNREYTRLFFVFLAVVLFVSQSVYAKRRVRKVDRIGKKVSFTTKDGIVIQGLFKPPKSSSKETFILLHGLGSNQEEWQPFISKFVRYGYGFLSYDARGHGHSILTDKNKKVTYQTFGSPKTNSNWTKMISDLDDAISFLQNKKGIKKSKMGLIGASLGANICFNYAAKDKTISIVVLLSPGMNYAGIKIKQSIPAYKKRYLLIMAAPGDTYAYQSACMLYKNIKENKHAVFMHGKNSGHGVNMLDRLLTNKLIGWINRH